MMKSEDLLDLALGLRDRIVVCELSRLIANFLTASTPQVTLSRFSLTHIRRDHRDMTLERLMLLPVAIKDGLIIREKARPQFLTVSYDLGDERFIAVLKATERKHAIFVETFHRARPRQTKSLLKRGRIIRAHALK